MLNSIAVPAVISVCAKVYVAFTVFVPDKVQSILVTTPNVLQLRGLGSVISAGNLKVR
jgi:hypothetical protein